MPPDDLTVSGAQGMQAGDNNVMSNFFSASADRDHWCRPAFERSDYSAEPGLPLKLRAFLHNPFPGARTVTLDLYGACADYVTVPGSVELPPRKRTAVMLTFAVAADHPPESVRVELGVRLGGMAEPVGEAQATVDVHARPALRMTLVDAVVSTRPPVSVAKVRVANTGNVAIRTRLSAVDDWSSSGSRPTDPPEVDLGPGLHRDVLVRTPRPRVRPVSRRHTGAVTVYADFDGGSVAGPVYEVPALISRVTMTIVAVLLLLLGLGAAVLRPTAGSQAPERSTAPDGSVAPTAVAEQSNAPVPVGGLPADLLFDVLTADNANTHTPVLVDRNRARISLPAGGRVTAVVKVPSGWVVQRQVNRDPAGIRLQLLYLRGGDVIDLAPGVPSPLFWIDATGTRIVVDGRAGKAGVITVTSLPSLAIEATTDLPADVRVVGWLDRAVLVSVPENGTLFYDRWLTGNSPYQKTASKFSGNVLGTVGGALIIHRRDGDLECVVQVPHLFEPVPQSLRCGLGVPVDADVLRGHWPAISPDGTYIAVPGPNRSLYVASLPQLLDGKAGFDPVDDLPGPIDDIRWRDNDTVAILVHDDDSQIWVCAAAGRKCQATPIEGPPDRFLLQLVIRVPAGD